MDKKFFKFLFNDFVKCKPFSPMNEFKRISPTSSSPEKHYETAKIHKHSDGDGIGKLSIRAIIYNLNTAKYNLVKYLQNYYHR